jgi:NAD-dependent dihydropyrimidine dehydrogenase PreA subunit
VPNPQFTKAWHGVPREQIAWNPTVLEDAGIGCGTCVTGCSRLVYRFDFERKKPAAVDPLNCTVGCTTCANTCPARAIAFPPIGTVLALIEQQARFDPQRDMVLPWGMRRSADCYALDALRGLLAQAPGLRVRLVAEQLDGAAPGSERLDFEAGTVLDALVCDPGVLTGRDLHIAAPPAMLRGLTQGLNARGIDSRRLHFDSFGI